MRSQTTPIIQQTNDLDTKTAADHRNIVDTDERAKTGIATAQSAANTADQHALAAGQSADAANKSAQEAYNRVDSLSGVVANLDNYKQLSDVNVTFAFDKYVLTADDKKQLDDLAANLSSTRGYILELTGGTDSVGDAPITISSASVAPMPSQTTCRASTTFLRTSSTSLASAKINRSPATAQPQAAPGTAAWTSSCSRT